MSVLREENTSSYIQQYRGKTQTEAQKLRIQSVAFSQEKVPTIRSSCNFSNGEASVFGCIQMGAFDL